MRLALPETLLGHNLSFFVHSCIHLLFQLYLFPRLVFQFLPGEHPAGGTLVVLSLHLIAMALLVPLRHLLDFQVSHVDFFRAMPIFFLVALWNSFFPG